MGRGGGGLELPADEFLIGMGGGVSSLGSSLSWGGTNGAGETISALLDCRGRGGGGLSSLSGCSTGRGKGGLVSGGGALGPGGGGFELGGGALGLGGGGFELGGGNLGLGGVSSGKPPPRCCCSVLARSLMLGVTGDSSSGCGTGAGLLCGGARGGGMLAGLGATRGVGIGLGFLAGEGFPPSSCWTGFGERGGGCTGLCAGGGGLLIDSSRDILDRLSCLSLCLTHAGFSS